MNHLEREIEFCLSDYNIKDSDFESLIQNADRAEWILRLKEPTLGPDIQGGCLNASVNISISSSRDTDIGLIDTSEVVATFNVSCLDNQELVSISDSVELLRVQVENVSSAWLDSLLVCYSDQKDLVLNRVRNAMITFRKGEPVPERFLIMTPTRVIQGDVD